jgi:hypothetical protein
MMAAEGQQPTPPPGVAEIDLDPAEEAALSKRLSAK